MKRKRQDVRDLRIVAWELTRRCNLRCAHCRAPGEEVAGRELTTAEMVQVMEEIGRVGKPMIILTGGEPTLREDFFGIARAGRDRGFRMVAAPNGTRVDKEVAGRMKEAGIQRVSISVDASQASRHDEFRGVTGAFAGALRGMEACREAGLPFQVNTSVTRANVDDVEKVLELAVRMGASAYHVFVLVPVGRGHDLAGEMLTGEALERLLEWLVEQRGRAGISVRATCAPQYYRILEQGDAPVTGEGMESSTRGCLAGRGFVFISCAGDVQPCGYLPVKCGNVLETPFSRIWQASEALRKLRDDSAIGGKCGVCGYVKVCGGCRARAYARTGDYMGEDPYCVYQPQR